MSHAQYDHHAVGLTILLHNVEPLKLDRVVALGGGAGWSCRNVRRHYAPSARPYGQPAIESSDGGDISLSKAN